MTAHTCVNRAPDGGSLPPCPACGEHFQAKTEAASEVLRAAKAFYRRNPNIERSLANTLDSAVGKLIALGDF